MTLNLAPLEDALKSLKIAVNLYQESHNKPLMIQDAFRDSVIKRFEYTYELSWKMMQRWIRENVSPEASDTLTRKDLYRLAAQKQLIDDPNKWFQYHQARNVSSHTYNQSNAETALKAAIDVVPDIQFLIGQLKNNQ